MPPARTVEELERELAQARQALAKAEHALAQSQADLKQFVYITSHDLKEPLRAISSYGQLISRRYSHAFDQDGQEFLAYLLAGAARLDSLLRGLLDYSRVIHAPAAPQEPVPLDEVLRETLDRLQLVIEDNAATIVADPLPIVPGDFSRLALLFEHLLENALRFRSDAPLEIRITATLEEDGWQVGVQDNGIGIVPEQQERIFSLFKRLHGPELPGIGLGLALCRRIMEQHCGHLWVQSDGRGGSTFWLRFPSREHAAAAKH